jgi:transposase
MWLTGRLAPDFKTIANFRQANGAAIRSVPASSSSCAGNWGCSRGRLIYRYTSVEDGMTFHSYWSSNCQTCALHDRCTTGKERRVRRWEHEAVVEAMERRLDRAPEAMRIRRQTVEQPFGTLKAWMGSTHVQMKTLKRVRTEASLYILAYNFKRLVAILGVRQMIAAIRT